MAKKKGRTLKIFTGWSLAFLMFAGIFSVVAFASSDESFKLFELRTAGDSFKSGDDSITSSSTSSGSPYNCDEVQTTTDGINFCGNIVNEQIYCKIKQTTEVLDDNGNVIASEQSPFFAGNPVTTFDFTDSSTGQSIEKGGFLVKLKAKCASDSKAITSDVFDGGLFNFPSVDIPLKIKDGSVLVKVISKKDGKDYETFNSNLSFDGINLTDPKEKNLGELRIGSDRILVYIPSGEYESQQRIEVSGDIDIVWRDFPSIDYRLHLEPSDIQTFRVINVVKAETTTPDVITCASGEQRQGNICVPVGTDGNSPNVQTLNQIQEIGLCLQSFDVSCLLQDKFIPYWVLGGGGLFLIGAITHNSAPRFDRFGNPIR